MSKVLSLRGNFTVDDNAILTDKQIFIYEAGDLTKGWEVESAFIWPRDTRAEIGTADGQYQANASLATDTINATQFDSISKFIHRKIGAGSIQIPAVKAISWPFMESVWSSNSSNIFQD